VDPHEDQLLWMYETMLVIRDFEERMVNIYLAGKLPPDIQHGLAFDIGGGPVPGEMQLAAGQEPVAVGVCAHLRDDDTVVGTHRPHHFAIAKGVGRDQDLVSGAVAGRGNGHRDRRAQGRDVRCRRDPRQDPGRSLDRHLVCNV
jgi:acetoin:2,6-dichlorophenolindophenol oxidoreductase subunit alpha